MVDVVMLFGLLCSTVPPVPRNVVGSMSIQEPRLQPSKQTFTMHYEVHTQGTE